jgi:hypothetical protein
MKTLAISEKCISGHAQGALFSKNSIFHNSFPRFDLQLEISRKSKYFLKWSRSLCYTRVYESAEK